jgi:hypothetical protein
MSNSSMPGVVRAYTADTGCSATNLPLPATLTDDLAGDALKRVNLLLLEYARDVTLLQSKAYDAILRAVDESGAG